MDIFDFELAEMIDHDELGLGMPDAVRGRSHKTVFVETRDAYGVPSLVLPDSERSSDAYMAPIVTDGYRFSELKKWRNIVLSRDGHRCVECGSGKYLTAHHIKSRASFPEFALDVENGITLCHEHHWDRHRSRS